MNLDVALEVFSLLVSLVPKQHWQSFIKTIPVRIQQIIDMKIFFSGFQVKKDLVYSYVKY